MGKTGRKPEHMTLLSGGRWVKKTDPAIAFRGKLDTLEAQFVLLMARRDAPENRALLSDLGEISDLLKKIMRAEVLNEKLEEISLFQLDAGQLRDYSHHPDEYFGVKAMAPPDYRMGRLYAELNLLRALTRETELAAVCAFSEGEGVRREDIVRALNRISSAVYIMMCRCLTGAYE